MFHFSRGSKLDSPNDRMACTRCTAGVGALAEHGRPPDFPSAPGTAGCNPTEQTFGDGVVGRKRGNMSASEGNAARAVGLALGVLLTAVLVLNALAF